MTQTIRFLLDENISRSVRNQLLFHEPGLDVICVGDENALPYGTLDPVILEWIEQMKEHLAQGKHIPGILLLRKRVSMSELIAELLLIWHASEPDEYYDHIRYLPL